MKKTILIFAAFFLITINNSYTQDKGLSKKTDPENMIWWKEATFGMFIHWGVYSQIAGTWDDSTYPGYSEHIFRMAEIPVERYKKEVAAKFNPTEFNAEEWVKICKDAGMKYMVITSKHHDGFAMFDSKVPGWGDDYDVVDATPFGRDPMKELKAACDKHGIKFGFYYSHSQDWSHQYGQRNNWDYKQPTARGKWYKYPEWKYYLEKSMIYVNEKSIPQLREIIQNYDPAIIWFDTKAWLPEDQNQIILTEARKLAPNTIFNSRSANGFEDYKTTADRPDEIPPYDGYWEAIPTTNESYGYHPGDTSHKPASHFIKLLSKTAARGGNLLLNVGPMPNGKIDSKDINILKEVGAWMKVNGEAIYGVDRTTLPVNAWGQSSIDGNKLYLHVFEWPKDNNLIVGGLKSEVKAAYLLSDSKKKKLKIERINDKDIIVKVPGEAPDKVVSIVVLECESDKILTDDVRLLTSKNNDNLLHVFDGLLIGNNIQYGKGSHRDNHLRRWSKSDSYIKWKVRANESTKYAVEIAYSSEPDSKGNKYIVEIGDVKFEGDVIPEFGYKSIKLGEVEVEKGETEVSVKALKINNEEFMYLRSITLTPVE